MKTCQFSSGSVRSGLVPSLLLIVAAGGLWGADVRDPAHPGPMVWMGYERLVDGQPQGVRVVLSKVQFQALRQAAGLVPSATEGISTVRSLPRIEVAWDPVRRSAELRWSRRYQGGSKPERISRPRLAPWTGEGLDPDPDQPALWIRPGAAGELVERGPLAIRSLEDSWQVEVPINPDGLGGELHLAAVPGWEPQVTAFQVPTAREKTGLPHATPSTVPVIDGVAVVPGGQAVVVWRRPVMAPAAGALMVDGAFRADPGPDGDGVRISGQVAISTGGAGFAAVDLTVPSGMAVAQISGDGVAGWMRTGDRIQVRVEPRRQRVNLTLDLWAAGEGQVLPQIAAERVRLRLAVGPWAGGSVQLDGGDRDSAQGTEKAAVVVRDASAVTLRLRPASTPDLGYAVEHLAIVDGPDRRRVYWSVASANPARITLPQGWTVIDGDVVREPDGGLLVRPQAGQKSGKGLYLVFDLPADADLIPRMGNSAHRQVLLVGSGDWDVGVDPRRPGNWKPEDAAMELRYWNNLGLSLAVAQLQAVSGSGEVAVSSAPRRGESTVSDSHFAVVERDVVRWSSHLEVQTGPGGLRELSIETPPGMTVGRIAAPAGATTSITPGRITVRLAGRTTLPFSIDLDADVALTAGAATVSAPRIRELRWLGGTVALAEADAGTSLLHRSGIGLEDGANPGLPDGVSADAVQHRLKALRPDWTLQLTRESLDLGSGPDGVATQVDALSWWLPDGELRSRVRWQVLNRSRSRIALHLPAATTLWEVRVGDRRVVPRQDERDPQVVWIPIPRQRAGEAAVRIEIESIAEATGDRLALPRIDGLRIMQVLWRIAGRDGITYLDGPFTAIDAAQAEADRAERASADLERLRAQTDLSAAARVRLDRELARLDLELADAQVFMASVPEIVQGSDPKWNLNILSKRKELKGFKDRNDEGQLIQNALDSQLNYGQVGNRSWNARSKSQNAANHQPSPQTPVVPPANQVSAPGLGDGDPVQGSRQQGAVAMTGADLLAGVPAGGLILRGTGAALEVQVVIPSTATFPFRWLIGAAALVLLGLGWRIRQQ